MSQPFACYFQNSMYHRHASFLEFGTTMGHQYLKLEFYSPQIDLSHMRDALSLCQSSHQNCSRLEAIKEFTSPDFKRSSKHPLCSIL